MDHWQLDGFRRRLDGGEPLDLEAQRALLRCWLSLTGRSASRRSSTSRPTGRVTAPVGQLSTRYFTCRPPPTIPPTPSSGRPSSCAGSFKSSSAGLAKAGIPESGTRPGKCPSPVGRRCPAPTRRPRRWSPSPGRCGPSRTSAGLARAEAAGLQRAPPLSCLQLSAGDDARPAGPRSVGRTQAAPGQAVEGRLCAGRQSSFRDEWARPDRVAYAVLGGGGGRAPCNAGVLQPSRRR